MIRAVYWTCALLAVARARVFERCELARRLAALGVDRDLSTWMCITYHESRFDTAARNTYSGDHGIFQISELYWCGPNKACGLPCSALRDDDIADDLECALKIREEHDRIQGNGFLAWVVYPQHCKHSTKKYIAGCDIQLKNATVRTASRSRLFIDPSPFVIEQNATSNTFKYNPDIDKLKPPYLTNSIVNDGYANLLEEKYSPKSAPLNWLNYKIDDIDKLTIPVSRQFENFPRFTPSTTTAAPTTTTSTTTAYPPIKVWRRIETNQFRKKLVTKKPTPEKWLELGKPASRVGLVAPTTTVETTSKSTPEPTTTVAAHPSTTESTPTSTPARTSASTASKFFTFTFTTPRTTKSNQTTFKPFVFTKSNQTTFKPFVFTTTTPKPTSAKHTTISTTTARTTTAKPIFNTVEFKPFVFTTKKPTRMTEKPTTERTTTQSSTITKKPTFAFTSRPSIPSTSISSSTKNWFKKVSFISTPAPKTTQFFQRISTTSKPVLTTAYKPRSTINFFPSITATAKSSLTTTARPLVSGVDPFSRSSRTSRLLSKGHTPTLPSTVRPFVTFTSRPTTTQRPSTRQASRGSAAVQHTTAPKTKPTQSIFDLYLNPTQRPKLPTNRFSNPGDSAFKLTIFSGGTTPAPRNITRRTSVPLGGAARNHVRRHI